MFVNANSCGQVLELLANIDQSEVCCPKLENVQVNVTPNKYLESLRNFLSAKQKKFEHWGFYLLLVSCVSENNIPMLWLASNSS
jgi:hypothetical protein